MNLAKQRRYGRKGGRAHHERRTHWTKGKRRHAEVRVPGWRSLPALIAVLCQYCDEHYGAQAALADSLGVHRKTVQTWLSGRKWPAEPTARRMAVWLRRQRRTGHPRP